MTFVTLNECPPGLFRTEDGTIGFKSEYTTTTGAGPQCDAYCVESGEYFHGGTGSVEARGALLVEPINYLDETDKLRMQSKHAAAELDEVKAAHDRTRDRLREAEAAKRDADNQRKFYESRATIAERRLEQAQGAAMELRGRLLEIRGNQMVRRVDLQAEHGLADPYDDQVPF